MTIELQTRTIYHCKCVRSQCRHEWDAFTKPKRCAKCKYLTWNGEDHRRKNPYEKVPAQSIVKTGQTAPKLHIKQVLDAFTTAKGIITKLIEDLEDSDVTQEQAALNKINKQIDSLGKVAGGGRGGKPNRGKAVLLKGDAE